jgi:uncharacterized membrane protein YpjA
MQLARKTNWALWLIFFINVAGTAVGYVYYYQQLSETPASLIPFVPDCPLYVGLFALLILLNEAGVRSDAFGLVVSVGLMKYAAWTLFVIPLYASHYLNPALPFVFASSVMLFALHIGMFLEGLTLPFRKISRAGLALCLAWFLLNDYLDYFGPAVHPYLPPGVDVVPAMAFAFASTIVFTLLAWRAWEKRARIRIRGLPQ